MSGDISGGMGSRYPSSLALMVEVSIIVKKLGEVQNLAFNKIRGWPVAQIWRGCFGDGPMSDVHRFWKRAMQTLVGNAVAVGGVAWKMK